MSEQNSGPGFPPVGSKNPRDWAVYERGKLRRAHGVNPAEFAAGQRAVCRFCGHRITREKASGEAWGWEVWHDSSDRPARCTNRMPGSDWMHEPHPETVKAAEQIDTGEAADPPMDYLAPPAAQPGTVSGISVGIASRDITAGEVVMIGVNLTETGTGRLPASDSWPPGDWGSQVRVPRELLEPDGEPADAAGWNDPLPQQHEPVISPPRRTPHGDTTCLHCDRRIGRKDGEWITRNDGSRYCSAGAGRVAGHQPAELRHEPDPHPDEDGTIRCLHCRASLTSTVGVERPEEHAWASVVSGRLEFTCPPGTHPSLKRPRYIKPSDKNYLPADSTCLHCREPIQRDPDGEWHDVTGNMEYLCCWAKDKVGWRAHEPLPAEPVVDADIVDEEEDVQPTLRGEVDPDSGDVRVSHWSGQGWRLADAAVLRLIADLGNALAKKLAEVD